MESYVFNSPIGALKLCEEGRRITGLSLISRDIHGTRGKQYENHSDLLYEAYRQLMEYFKGERMTFDLPLECRGTPFQQKVWRELQKIPYGQVRSYQDIAFGVGNEKAVRAVGQANNKNPIMIIVPCHRVIHKNGDITGFGCGTEVKRFLLDLEKIPGTQTKNFQDNQKLL